MRNEITSILLNETNRDGYKVKDTRDYPTIIALFGNTANCVNELITPALEDFSQETGLSVGVLEIDWSTATCYDEAVKIWKEQVEVYELKSKNVIALHNFTRLPAIFGSRKLQSTIGGLLSKGCAIGNENGWTGWHLIMITDDATDDGVSDPCWMYFRRKSCLNTYQI